MRPTVLIAGCCLVGLCSAAETKIERDESVEQLEVFDPYIGEWTFSMETTDGVVMTGTMATAWIHGGKWVRQSWQMEPVAGRPPASGETTLTYDTFRNVYRQWSIDSYGLSSEATGTWDSEKQVMIWTGQDALKHDVKFRSSFTNPNKEEFTVKVTAGDGTTIVDMNGTATRKSVSTK